MNEYNWSFLFAGMNCLAALVGFTNSQNNWKVQGTQWRSKENRRFAHVGMVSKQLQVPRSSVQTTVRKYESGCNCRTKLPPWVERKLLRMFGNNRGATEAQACHELETAGTPASPSTVKPKKPLSVLALLFTPRSRVHLLHASRLSSVTWLLRLPALKPTDSFTLVIFHVDQCRISVRTQLMMNYPELLRVSSKCSV